MKKFFLVYSHPSTNSFNAAIKETVIETIMAKNDHVDILDLYAENHNPIYRLESTNDETRDHRDRIDACDTIIFITPVWNYRMPAMMEGWIDKTIQAPWAFTFKKLLTNCSVPSGNLCKKTAIIFTTSGSTRLSAIPTARSTKRIFCSLLRLCGIKKINYRRYYAVPFVSQRKRQRYLRDVHRTINKMC